MNQAIARTLKCSKV